MLCLGNTPLVRINSLSDALGVEILGKAEVRADSNLFFHGSLKCVVVLEYWRKCEGSRSPAKCVLFSALLRTFLDSAAFSD